MKLYNKYLINYILEIVEINDVKYKYHTNYRYKSGGDKHEQKKNSYIIVKLIENRPKNMV